MLGASTEDVKVLATSAPTPTPLLDIRSEFRTNTPSERSNSHARTKFGKPAITRIFRAAGACDRLDSDVGNYLFLTATLPGDTDESKWAIAEYAHEIIDNLKSWLSKRLLSRNEFYVWENQKRGALHFHYCLHCPDKQVQAEITKNFKREIVRLYDGIEKKHGCNLWGKWYGHTARYRTAILQARVEVVYRSVGAYMAGYLGGKGSKHSQDENHRYYPKRWFGVSRPLSALIKSYTQETTQEFDSLKTASEFYEAKKEEFSENALTIKPFPHKVGEGKTTVFFHTQENQEEIWESQKMLTHSQQAHPNIAAFISVMLKTTQRLQTLSKKYRCLRERLPLKLLLCLQDVTFSTSMKNGALSRTQVQMMELAFSSYDYASDSKSEIRNFFITLRECNLLTAAYFPQMRFNKAGLLDNQKDFNVTVDKLLTSWYVGTNTSDVEAQNELDGHSGHVPSGLGSPSFPEVCQTSLFPN